MWLSANACWLCLVGLYLCSGVDLCEVVRVGTHHCAGCCVLKAAELSRGSSSGPTQTGICTLRCHSGLLQPRCWSRSGTPAGSGGGHVNAETTLGIINKVWKHLSWYLLRLLWLYWSILWHYWQYFGDRRLCLLRFYCREQQQREQSNTTHPVLGFHLFLCHSFGLCDQSYN